MTRNRLVWLLLLSGTFLTNLSVSLVFPFLPILIKSVGVRSNTEFWAGLAFSITYLASAIMAPIWGSTADRIGFKPMLVRSGLGIGAVYFLLSFSTNLYFILSLRLIHGMISGFVPAAAALSSLIVPKEEQGRTQSKLQSASLAGNVLGPLVGGVLGEFLGFRFAFAIAGGLMVLNGIFIALGLQEPERIPKTLKKSGFFAGAREFLNNPSFKTIVLASFLFQIAGVAILPVLSTYGSSLTIEPLLKLAVARVIFIKDESSILTGLIFSIPTLIALIAIPWWGKRIDKVGYSSGVNIGLVGGTITSLLQFFAPSLGIFIAIRALNGFFVAAVQSGLRTAVTQATPPNQRGRGFGLYQSVSTFTFFLGPILGGWIYSVYSKVWLIVFIGVLQLGALIVVALNIHSRKKTDLSGTT